MRFANPLRAGIGYAVAALLLSGLAATAVQAQTPTVDPAAVQILRRMTDYLGGLRQFSAHTQNTLEDTLASGQRVDLDIAASVTVSRPNQLRAERYSELASQAFYYDGKTLTLFSPADGAYATVGAPATIEEMLDFAREDLGLVLPVADLVYRNAFDLLMRDVSSATVLGKAFIDGVRCDHLAFHRPGVDFQVWIADSGPPLPRKYVVTDTATPANVSITTVISGWNVAPVVADARFIFVPPQEAKPVAFMSIDASGSSSR